MSRIEKAIEWMENKAMDDSHGYDQKYRWGEKGDYDCSSAVISAWEQAGVPVKTKGATYTGNMKNVFLKCGFSDITKKINLKTGKGLQRGDVLLNAGFHTAMYCGNGKEVEASINEKGNAIGGIPGDQTGREFLIRSYRNYPWTSVLRYTAEQSLTLEEAAQNVLAGKYGNGNKRKRAIEDLGLDYAAVQKRVNEILRMKSKSAPVYYTVRSGDTLSAIARRYGTTVSAIQKLNVSLIRNVNQIRVGWKIRVK